MVREIMDKDFGGVRITMVVPDCATRKDEVDEIVYFIKYYKSRADRIARALESLEKVAEEDEDVRWLLEDEGLRNYLNGRKEYYLTISLDLLKELAERSSAEELVGAVAPALYLSDAMVKVTSEIIKSIIRGRKKWGGEKPLTEQEVDDSQGDADDQTADSLDK